MRYRLRTLMILVAVGPPALALCWLRLDLVLSFVILFAEVYFLLWFVHYQEMKSLQRAKVEELIRKRDEFQKEIELVAESHAPTLNKA